MTKFKIETDGDHIDLKIEGMEDLKKLIEARRDQVAKIRDKIRDEVDELEGLLSSCDEAHEALQSAIDYLSQYA